MDSKSFKTKAEICHKEWLSKALGIPVNAYLDIDLQDNEIGIELKSRYTIYTHKFTIAEYQVEEFRQKHSDKELFWALMIYDLRVPIKNIKSKTVKEFYISSREVWFFDWEWVKQFPVFYPKTGPFRYAKIQKYDPIEITEKKGVLNIPRNSILEERLC